MMSFLYKLRWFFKQRWMQYLIGTSLLSIANLLFLIPPKFIGDMIDEIRSGTFTAETLYQKVSFLSTLSIGLYFMIFCYFSLLLGSAIVLEKQLKTRLFTHLTKMTPNFYQRNRIGDLMAISTNDVSAISSTAGSGIISMIFTFVGTSIVLVAMIVLIDYRLVLVTLIPLPFLTSIVGRLGETLRARILIAQQSFGNMNNHAFESISGLRVIRSFVQEKKDIQAFDLITADVMKKNSRVAFTRALIQPVTSTIIGFCYAIAIGYGSYLVFHNQISLGQLVTFNIYLGLIIWPLVNFGEFINMIKRGSASVERVDSILEQLPEVMDAANLVSIELPTSIEMKNLNFRYPGAMNESLRQISFHLERGQTLGIVGRTGSGKSTLLKQLLRQYPIESDKLFIAGTPIEKIALEEMSAWIGYVPQDYMLISKSIKNNIILGKPDAKTEEIQRVIDLTCLKEDIDQMKDGWDTIIGEGGIMLSGGQKQRTAIARALLVNPEILILDDVLSAVDAKTENHILHNIRKERREKTTLIATHRLSAVNHADWILVLDNGEIIEEGTHEQLLYRNGWYKQQYDRQKLEVETLHDGKESI
ncbi:multidrug ABC transporter ATP-binding protein [Paenibacillus tyrfis]|uniref:Multidrug ABC transporter ATP-binding protein n=2 Tax=Paenibacillus tyrfis TaxID=1501230 RepID=A0A081NTN2_9BACL|nr:multidrug ABC transporter ATP-binding protein [Paenibacillus tyrfis]